jgi:MFS family permease
MPAGLLGDRFGRKRLLRSAFIHGMDIMLWTCGGIAVVSALLALAFLPGRAGGHNEERGARETRGGQRSPRQPAGT